jgi:lipoprotein-anchoring transpeptidase ErfK/SrfK
MAGFVNFFRHGGKVAWGLIGAVVLVLGLSTVLLANTADVRYERDVTRMVFNDNLELLEDVKKQVGATQDTLEQTLASGAETPGDQPYIVVSIADNRMWYKKGDQTLFTTQVATGSGKVLEREGGDKWKFETPRGRLVVQSKETDPVWVPPDWHYMEMAKKHGLGVIHLNRNQSVPLADGSSVAVSGNDVVKRLPDGREIPFEVKEGKEIVANGNIIVPPYGTNQRKYLGVLGTHRLYLGDGYGLHGTDNPASIGHSASHGCVRLRNEDIETLYQMVPVGTAVYIY